VVAAWVSVMCLVWWEAGFGGGTLAYIAILFSPAMFQHI